MSVNVSVERVTPTAYLQEADKKTPGWDSHEWTAKKKKKTLPLVLML